MRNLQTGLIRRIGDIRLRPALAIGLIIGLSLPIAVSVWRDVTERRTTHLAHLDQDHERIVQTLAIGMQTPIWDVRPETGKPLIDTLMLDERITGITVSAPLLPDFLAAKQEVAAGGEILTRRAEVVRNGETIGRVEVAMSTAQLEAEVGQQWRQVLATGFMQLALGLLILLPLLRLKVLEPIDRLVGQSRALASGVLDEPTAWRQRDELGTLGRSFEEMRGSLRRLFQNLEKRNLALQERENELERNSNMLRAILENMTDGITLVDSELRVLAWNDRLADILGTPRELMQEGVSLEEVTRLDLLAHGVSPDELPQRLQKLRDSFRPGIATTYRVRTASGRDIDIRRRPLDDGCYVSTYTDVTDEVAAQQQAEETLTLLETVMDAVPAMLHVKGADLRYEMANRRYLDYCGRDQADVIGRVNADIFPEGVTAKADRLDRLVRETRRQLPFYEATYAGAGGEPLTFWTTKLPLLGVDGEVTHILTVEIDISERKHAEQERQRWLQLFQDAIQSMPNGFAVYDADDRLVTCNTAYADLYDTEPMRLVGVDIDTLIGRASPGIRSVNGREVTSDDMASVRRVKKAWFAQSEPLEVEMRDGRWLLMSRHATAEGGFVAIRTDISDLKRMQEALRESEALIRRVLESSPVPVGMTRAADGKMIYESPASKRVLGRDGPGTDQLSAIDHFVSDADRKQVFSLLQRTHAVDDFEMKLRRLDGSEFWAAVSARLISYQDDEVIVYSIIDLTERRAVETEIARQREALHQSEKLNALGGLLAGVAHELNNPLSVVVGQSQLLEETVEDPSIRQRAAVIGKSANRCSRIIKTFLAMARQSAPERKDVDINDVIWSALDVMGYALRSADVELSCELADDPPPVWGDADQLTQVAMNLIVNAEQAMVSQAAPRKLSLTTMYDLESDEVCIAVQDSGPGIPAELRKRIFEPFFTTKDVGAGTGIGLAVSRGIVEAHKGEITLESAPDQGACFTIRLPSSQRARRDAEAPKQPAPVSVAARVLIVDDEPEVVTMLSDILAVDGHDVAVAASGNAALKLTREFEFDAILSDIRMPDLDGPGFYEALRQEAPQTVGRLAFITGDALGQSVQHFLSETGARCLEKPFSPDEIRQLVADIVAKTYAGAAE